MNNDKNIARINFEMEEKMIEFDPLKNTHKVITFKSSNTNIGIHISTSNI